MQFFKIGNFFNFFLHIVYDNRFVARKSTWAVPFGSDTSLKSELGYQCLIFRVIYHYGQFQNGRSKIHDFSWNVLSSIVFLNFKYYYKGDLGQWRSDNSHFNNYVSQYKSDIGH